ncbi:MAG: HDIG domain-containing protein [Clostridiales bacterium]|nr:HDIG domain-containing protein [Clostridiales bacterium]
MTKKTVLIDLTLFVLNVLLLLAISFLMIELNQKLGMHAVEFIKNNTNKVIFVVATVLFLSVLTFGYLYFESIQVLQNILKLIEMFVLLDLSLFLSFIFGAYLNPAARPFGFFAIMCATLLGRRQAMFINIINALLIFVMDININLTDPASGEMWQYCAGLLITFCAGTTVVFVSHKIKTRLQSILIVFLLLVPIELIIGIMQILFSDTHEWILLGYGALGALFSTLLFMVLLPVFELSFAELTVFRLREITSPNAPLIKRLKEQAPGTYNHSVVVSQLAEACAIAVGEDSELARAAAYYHDVGKLVKPEMFTENQSDYNVHNELSPELSADIIRSHTKDGAKLIKKAHLPEFLSDIAIQHHGTLPIKYFYAKALKMTDGEISMANYSYPGPVPQTRIAAIIMIVDAAEAATRSLANRTPANIEALVSSLIEERMNLDQFVDCNITMRDLSIISHTIAQSLSGVYHSRISYPKIKIGKKN